ncbi:hypothetical protein BDZ45DRAFT_692315 [Acephala macrosclerotiorum]|nr:hypothetical protein BDZ45DRAFT_692315 [Acephala macrosclerotiorum]
MFLQVWLVLFVALTQGYTTFTTTCKTPEVTVNFVSSPNARGSLDILWSSLFTILACTWNVLYLNVREQRDGRDSGWLGNIKWAWKDFWPNLKWMVIAVFAPEVLLAKNVADLKDARIDEAGLRPLAMEDGVPWTQAHSMYANMGGFVIRGFTDRFLAAKQDKQSSRDSEAGARDLGIASAEKEARPDVELENETSTNQFQESIEAAGECRCEETRQLVKTQEQNFIIRAKATWRQAYNLSHRSRSRGSQTKGVSRELALHHHGGNQGQGKAGGFSRAVAVLQILWMAVQTIARKTGGIPISPLEVAVMAFAANAIIIYVFNADKPKGVRTPTTLLRYEDEIPESVRDALAHGSEQNPSDLTLFITLFRRMLFGKPKERRLDHPVPNSYNRGRQGIALDFTGNFEGLIIGGVVFGAVHITAWNFTFPTKAELILWRVASLWCTASVLVGFFIYTLSFFSERLDELVGAVSISLIVLIAVLYILARLFLIVERFRTLCFLPPEAYVTTWTSNVLHAG